MQTEFILDTNAAIYLKKGGLSGSTAEVMQRAITPVACLSVISKIELLGFRFPDSAEQEDMESFIGRSLILPITDSIVDETIRLRRLHRIKLPDLLIAATAIVHNLTLVTRNTPDFQAIDKLLVINPFDL